MSAQAIVRVAVVRPFPSKSAFEAGQSLFFTEHFSRDLKTAEFWRHWRGLSGRICPRTALLWRRKQRMARPSYSVVLQAMSRYSPLRIPRGRPLSLRPRRSKRRVSGGVGTLAGGGILVFGGNVDGDVSNSAVQYDYTGSNTHNAASLHTSRYLFGYATDENHHVYAIGGKNSSGVVQTSVEVYNATTNAWSTVAPLPTALYGLSAAADDTGHVFAFGGITSIGAISSVYRYTIATNTWATVTSLPTATDNGAAVLG